MSAVWVQNICYILTGFSFREYYDSFKTDLYFCSGLTHSLRCSLPGLYFNYLYFNCTDSCCSIVFFPVSCICLRLLNAVVTLTTPTIFSDLPTRSAKLRQGQQTSDKVGIIVCPQTVLGSKHWSATSMAVVAICIAQGSHQAKFKVLASLLWLFDVAV